MASYLELSNMPADANWPDFQKKIRIAVAKKAQIILDTASPTAAQVAWAKSALANKDGVGEDVQWYVLAANSTATVAQIFAASDTAIQNNVDAAVDKLAV